MRLFGFLFSSSLVLGALAFPSEAFAIEVECSNEEGSCRVRNDRRDSVSCTCEDGSSFAGFGGDRWADLNADKLLEICEEELTACPLTGGGGGWGTTTTGDEPGASTSGDGATSGDTGASGYGSTTKGEEPSSSSSGSSTGGIANESGTTASEPDAGPVDESEDASASVGQTPGAGQDGGQSSAGCSMGGGGASSAWLALLGLIGLRRSRRGTVADRS